MGTLPLSEELKELRDNLLMIMFQIAISFTALMFIMAFVAVLALSGVRLAQKVIELFAPIVA